MPVVRYGDRVVIIQLDKIYSVGSILRLCKIKFRDKKITIVRFDRRVLSDQDINLLTNKSTLYCYANNKDVDFSKEEKQPITKHKAEVIRIGDHSYISPQLLNSVEHLAKQTHIHKITIYPNANDECLIPKGTVVEASKLILGTGARLGRGTTVWGIKNIIPKLKRLRSINIHTYDGYAEIHQIVSCCNSGYQQFNYLLVVRSGDTNKCQKILGSILNKDNASLVAGCNYEEQTKILTEQFSLIEHNRRIRNNIADAILKRLSIIDAEEICDQIENIIVKIGNSFIHRNNVCVNDTGLSIITGSRDNKSYLVTSDGAPSGAGRRHSFFKTTEIAKNHNGEIVSSLRNNRLVTEDKRFIYERYSYGYKNTNHVITDIEDIVDIVLVSEPLITYRR